MSNEPVIKKPQEKYRGEEFEFARWLKDPAHDLLNTLYCGLYTQLMAELMADVDEKFVDWEVKIKQKILFELQKGKSEIVDPKPSVATAAML